MKYLWVLMIMLTIGLQYRLWVGEGSFSEAWSLQERVDQERLKNQVLVERNGHLDAEVTDLKSGHDAIEEHARNDLGMIGPNETFFVVVSSGH